ncbi:hypothetical protein D3C87_1767030 [compost metagenome]
MSANRSPVRKASSSEAIMALAFSGSASWLIFDVASAINAARFGSVAWMYFCANAMLDSSVDMPFCKPVCIEPL